MTPNNLIQWHKGDATEWHLLKLFRVTMFSDERACSRARYGKQRIGFRSSFESAGLDTAGALTDVLLGDEDKQAIELVVVDSVGVVSPGDPDSRTVCLKLSWRGSRWASQAAWAIIRRMRL